MVIGFPTEGTSSEGVEKTTQKEEEERAETERMEVGEEQKQQEENNGMGGGGGGRRKPAEQGSRIAYLYGWCQLIGIDPTHLSPAYQLFRCLRGF